MRTVGAGASGPAECIRGGEGRRLCVRSPARSAFLAKARQIKQGMMQELLTGRIRLV
jgi:hypothetical protein